MRINKSAARSMDLLLLLAERKEKMSLLEIEQALEIPKSSTFELVYTLVEKGFIDQVDKKFLLGINAFLVGSSYSDKLNLIQISKPILTDLSKETEETVFLAKHLNSQIIYLDKYSDYAGMASTCKIGSSKGMYYTGLGKSILAAWSESEVINYFNSTTFEKFTEKTIVTLDELLIDLEKSRTRGYAMEITEGKIDTFCVSAPIFNHQNEVIASISVTAHIYQMDKKLDLMIELITKAALTISTKLGYTKNALYS